MSTFSMARQPPAASADVDPLAGHLGHLTDAQQAALDDFKERLAQAKLYAAGDPPSHDDPTLLRFLRARKFDPAQAYTQFADFQAWRKKNNVEELYKGFDADELESSRRFYPRWTGRRNKMGYPMFVYRLASLSGPLTKELHSISAQRRSQRIIVLYEWMCCFILPFCSTLPRATAPTPVTSSMSIIDLEGVSLSSIFTLRSHFGEASSMATANYPETLNTICIVNSPSYFPTIWSWLKGWFDEGTRSKIFILGPTSNPKTGETLRTLVDAENLPKAYGGELEWVFADEPALDDAAQQALPEGKLPRGPVVFVDGEIRPP